MSSAPRSITLHSASTAPLQTFTDSEPKPRMKQTDFFASNDRKYSNLSIEHCHKSDCNDAEGIFRCLNQLRGLYINLLNGEETRGYKAKLKMLKWAIKHDEAALKKIDKLNQKIATMQTP